MSITTKAELAEKYKMSPSKLQNLMNRVFYDELLPLHYEKNCSKIPPRVVQKFVELYGEPKDFLNESQ